MANWFSGFLIPIIECFFIGGFVLAGLYFTGRAVWNGWSKKFKFVFRYKIPFRKKSYPESSVKWVMSCIDKGLSYYDVKKILMTHDVPTGTINENLWIYLQIVKELNLEQEVKNNGRIFSRSSSKDQSEAELPTE